MRHSLTYRLTHALIAHSSAHPYQTFASRHQGVNIAERIRELEEKGLAQTSDNPVKVFIWNDKNPNKVRGGLHG